MTEFDRWVYEAPARHLGVFALVIIATAALLMGGCTDRGRCLHKHKVHVAASMTVVPIYMPNGQGGGSMSFFPVFTPEHDSLVCDKWEYPDGKYDKLGNKK